MAKINGILEYLGSPYHISTTNLSSIVSLIILS